MITSIQEADRTWCLVPETNYSETSAIISIKCQPFLVSIFGMNEQSPCRQQLSLAITLVLKYISSHFYQFYEPRYKYIPCAFTGYGTGDHDLYHAP